MKKMLIAVFAMIAILGATNPTHAQTAAPYFFDASGRPISTFYPGQVVQVGVHLLPGSSGLGWIVETDQYSQVGPGGPYPIYLNQIDASFYGLPANAWWGDWLQLRYNATQLSICIPGPSGWQIIGSIKRIGL